MDISSKQSSLYYMEIFQDIVNYEVGRVTNNLSDFLKQSSLVGDVIKKEVNEKTGDDWDPNSQGCVKSVKVQSVNFINVIGKFILEIRKFNSILCRHKLESIFLDKNKNLKVLTNTKTPQRYSNSDLLRQTDTEEGKNLLKNGFRDSCDILSSTLDKQPEQEQKQGNGIENDNQKETEIEIEAEVETEAEAEEEMNQLIETDDKKQIPMPNLKRYMIGFTFLAKITHIFDDGITFFATNIKEADALSLTLKDAVEKLETAPQEELFGVRFSMDNEVLYRAFLLRDKVHMVDYGDFRALSSVLEIYRLNELIRILPPKAVKCCIMGVNEPKLEIPKEKSFYIELLKKNVNEKIQLRVMYHVEDTLYVHLMEDDQNTKDCFLMEDNKAKEDKLIMQPPPSFEMWKRCVELSVGQRYTIIVTYVIGSTFFGQINENFTGNKKPYYTDSEILPIANALDRTPHRYDLLMGKSNNDNLWYRVLVKKVDEARGKASVRYVDYGECEYLPISRLIHCPTSLLDGQFEAIHCQLSGLIDLSKGDSHLTIQATSILERLVEKEINIEVEERIITENKELMYTVRIMNPEFHYLGKELVDKGCAIYSDLLSDEPDITKMLPTSTSEVDLNSN